VPRHGAAAEEGNDMTSRDSLSLQEELLLLALKEKKGTVAAAATFDYALAGAILAELLLHKRVTVVPGRSKLLEMADPRPLGDPLLDEALGKVKDAKRRANLKTWVQRFARIKKLRQRIARGLCLQGILRADEDKVLLIFTRKLYPEIDPRPEKAIVERLRRAIFTETQDVDPRTVVLVSLSKHVNVLKNAFDGKELRARKQRLKQLVEGEIAGKATQEAIQAMQAAVFVAAIMLATMS